MKGRRPSSGIPGARAAAGALCAALLLGLAPAAASGGEVRVPKAEDLGSRPIEITADRLSADSAQESVTFEGNVVARQDDVTLHADRVFAEYSRTAKAIEKITADGNVRVIHAGKEARAAHAVFYNLEQRIVLSGGADLLQGENALRGETMTIWLRENRSVVTGGEGGRVRAVIHPKGPVETKGKDDR